MRPMPPLPFSRASSCLLDNDDELRRRLWLKWRRLAQMNKDADLLYSDEDKIDLDGGFCDHYFKPDNRNRSISNRLCIFCISWLFGAQLCSPSGGCGSGCRGTGLRCFTLRNLWQNGAPHRPCADLCCRWRKIPGSAAAVVDAKPYGLGWAERLRIISPPAGGVRRSVPGWHRNSPRARRNSGGAAGHVSDLD